MSRSWWYMASGQPYRGWKRFTHSYALPTVITIVLSLLARRLGA